MATNDDDTLPLQPPVRLPSEAELAAAVRAAPLTTALLRPTAPATDGPEQGSGASEEELLDEAVREQVAEVLREGEDRQILRTWTEVCRDVLLRDEQVFLCLVRLFMRRERLSGPPGVLGTLGLVRRVVQDPPPTGTRGRGRKAGGGAADAEMAELYTLSPLGSWAARGLVSEASGQDIPVMGSFATQDAAALLQGLRSYPEPERLEELTGWLAGKDRGEAAEEVGAALAAASPLGRAVGVDLLATDFGDEGRLVLDRLIDTPRLGAVIAARLGRDERPSTPEEIAWALVDMAATLLEFGGETDEVIASISTGMDAEEQAGTLALFALGDHPWTAQVLRVFIDHHPDERVAAAARKALRRLHGLASIRG
ncbi:hypothetical protein GCM10010149_16140 [Nonomuraea roseoviolacea subsp. roseoviolacea]|uniref:HEAT repeat domain-containing protein n=1 Tax=Nonomuraea roseoviolacea subsp. carminata TaxID=160689 RepID=A0ABT1KEB8_9ACTN|nr:hypothetical protein [Nonomuraea roseoviolacea]MCP2352364.1 hypothetical protein [Nonomuraea roseoviolacea subsp. carminata]